MIFHYILQVSDAFICLLEMLYDTVICIVFVIIQYLAKGKKELIFNHLLGIMLHPRVTHI